MRCKDTFPVPTSGRLELRFVERSTGRIVHAIRGENLIVNGGVNAMPNAYRAVITHVVAGTSVVGPSPADILPLQDQIMVPVAGSELPAPNQVRWSFIIDGATGNGLTLTEFGLVTADGVLAARKVFITGFPKHAEIEIHGKWTWTFAYTDEEA